MSATQIYYMLQWPKEAPPMVDGMVEEHRIMLDQLFREVCWVVKNNAPDFLVELLSGLHAEEDTLREALLAPHLCRSLTVASQTLTLADCQTALREWRAEVRRLCTPSTPPRLLGDSLIIDFDSPQCRRIEPESSTLCRTPLEPTPEMRATVLEKLDAAMALVDEMTPTAGIMIRHVTRYVRLRFAEGNVVAAETDPRDLGEIRLLNAHLPQTRVIDLADALIHESLHNFLAMYERRHGHFVAYRQTALSRPVSPWSGNPIPYNAFTHAVFIYYGLFHFYRQLYSKSDNAQLRHEATELIVKCSRGFRLAELEDCLRMVGDSPSWLFALYRKMSIEVRGHYDMAPALITALRRAA